MLNMAKQQELFFQDFVSAQLTRAMQVVLKDPAVVSQVVKIIKSDTCPMTSIWPHCTRGGQYYKFVELCIFLYNLRFLFSFLCRVNICQLNDNSHSINTYIFALTFWLKPISTGKNGNSEY